MFNQDPFLNKVSLVIVGFFLLPSPHSHERIHTIETTMKRVRKEKAPQNHKNNSNSFAWYKFWHIHWIIPCEKRWTTTTGKQIRWAITCALRCGVCARARVRRTWIEKKRNEKKRCYSLEFACDNVTVLYFSFIPSVRKTMDKVPLVMKNWTHSNRIPHISF